MSSFGFPYLSTAGGHPVVKAQRVSEAIAGLAVKPVLYLYSGQEQELSPINCYPNASLPSAGYLCFLDCFLNCKSQDFPSYQIWL
jgi:hypothetical protein